MPRSGTFAPRSNAPLRSGFPGKQSGRKPVDGSEHGDNRNPAAPYPSHPAAATNNRDPHLNDSTRRENGCQCHIFATSFAGSAASQAIPLTESVPTAWALLQAPGKWLKPEIGVPPSVAVSTTIPQTAVAKNKVMTRRATRETSVDRWDWTRCETDRRGRVWRSR